jgi:hypothetical protein
MTETQFNMFEDVGSACGVVVELFGGKAKCPDSRHLAVRVISMTQGPIAVLGSGAWYVAQIAGAAKEMRRTTYSSHECLDPLRDTRE